MNTQIRKTSITTPSQLNDIVATRKVICSIQQDSAVLIILGPEIEIIRIGKRLFTLLRNNQVLYPSTFYVIDNQKLHDISTFDSS